MTNFPDHMFQIGEMIFISVNTFQKHTRVHIHVYAADDRGILHPTKSGVSLKPEVWSALHSKLSCFRPREDFESASLLKKTKSTTQRRYLDQLHDSYELVLKCVKNKLLTYTLSEYVMAEVDRLPEIDSFYYDVDSPHGLHELFESLEKVLSISNGSKVLTHILNLDDFEWPKVNDLPSSDVMCPFSHKKNFNHCAVYKVRVYGKCLETV
ncbi:PC4 domain-containing protein [Trichonephila clavata]|uniref:PC4 domain-containing protein n=1 Tax=Trichonephila clavata TaxID=2740835 RepID=A0A8X6KFR5_TRICU|nr:PC4 domain-containing protein [Trichonephila clavata]